MAPKRRKSVSFNPNPDELSGPSTRRRNLLAETPAPAAQLKRAAPAPPAQPESDDGFKFKRRKPASKAAPSREPEPAPTPAPAAAPAPSSRSTRASRAAASASTPTPAAAAPAPAPASKAPKAPKAPVASTGLIPTREAESAAGPADAGVEAVAAGPAMNLDGVPPEMLRALLQACLAIEPGDAANDGEAAETQRAVSECMHEIRRQGVFQVDPANENESLRQREAALQRCVAMLSDALRQWTALGEASPARLGADAAAPAAPELDLPPLPEMSEALTQLHTVAALHADQVEATMRRLDTMCEESARQRKQMSTTAHQAAFGGYLDVNEPRMLIRSLVAA